MREIKFRGMFNEEKWVYGMYVDGFIVNGVVEATDEYIAMENWCPVDVDTIGQYTGLKDNEGQEIYEGDIVEFRPWNREEAENYIVKFISDDASFRGIKEKKSSIKVLSLINSEQGLKIMGNISENPELLREEE